MKYNVRYVHKIQPLDTDMRTFPVNIPDEALADRKALGKVLRDQGVLCHGERIDTFRVEANSVVVFPCASTWHSIILTFAE